MKTFTASTLAAAILLAFAVSASAQTTSGTTSTNANATGTMHAPSDKANMPEQCRSMTGRELGNCLKMHGGASGNAMSGTTGMRDNSAIKNDKSGSGSGSVGGGTGPAGTAGTTGSSSSGATGGTGSTGGSGPGK